MKKHNTKQNEKLSKCLINPFPLSIINCWDVCKLSLNCHFLSQSHLVKTLLTLNILKYIHLICMFWLAHYYCDIDIPWVCHIFTQPYSLFSLSHLRVLRITAKNVRLWSRTDGDFRTERAYCGQESTLGTDCLYSEYCTVCTVPSVMYRTALYRHCTRRNTDATREQLLIWFQGLLGDYIDGLFVKINKIQLELTWSH